MVSNHFEDPQVYNNIANVLLLCGEAEEAQQSCRRALEIDSRHLESSVLEPGGGSRYRYRNQGQNRHHRRPEAGRRLSGTAEVTGAQCPV